jgi:hypothetical protein
MKSCKVNLSGGKGIDALVYGYWNGFSRPMIPFRAVDEFAREYTNDDFIDISFTNGVLRLYDMQESHTEIICPIEIEGELFYDLGNLGFCFEEI